MARRGKTSNNLKENRSFNGSRLIEQKFLAEEGKRKPGKIKTNYNHGHCALHVPNAPKGRKRGSRVGG